MSRVFRISSHLLVVVLLVALAPTEPALAADPWLEEDFTGGAGAIDSYGVVETSAGHEGNGIRVDIPKGQHWGTTTHWNTKSNVGSEPEEMWMRYWIKFPNGFQVDSPYRGKLPGFGGLYTYNCLGGRPSTASEPCWSARMAFSPLYAKDGLPDYSVDPSEVTRISFYAYLLDSSDVGQTGAILNWDPNKSTLQHNRWYCVEARVKVNSLGEKNGVLEGYVDGSQAFKATNLKFRRATESHLKVKSLWFDVYYGNGDQGTSPKDNQIYFDSVAAGPSRIGCNDNPGSNGTFYDDDTSIFENDIERLAASGITKGCNPPANDRFCPDQSVTRGQMSAFLERALGDEIIVDLPETPGSPPDFWGARSDLGYKTALSVYSDGGAPLDTYVVTYPIDETGTSKDWTRTGVIDNPGYWVPIQLESIWQRGATPFVRVEVDDLGGLLDGRYDVRLSRMLAAFETFVDQGGGRRLMLDILPEPNNARLPYGDDPSGFKSAFRRVANEARTRLGDKVRVVFTGLNDMYSNRYSSATWGVGGFRLFWPGNSYVDVAGISGYADRSGSDVGLYRSAVVEMVDVVGPGMPIVVSSGGAPNVPDEKAQIEFVAALADLAASHDQIAGIQWEDRVRDGDDMRVSSKSGLQPGFATASSQARSGGVDWLFSKASDQWAQERLDAIPFDDSASSIFVDSIRWLAATGITKGCGPRQFCPDQFVTRGQMAAFMSRALDLASPKSPIVFDDTRGHLFENAISKLANAGITKGCNPPANDRFCPDQDVTRGQMAAFMVRAGLTD